MLQVIPKWKVVVRFSELEEPLILFISDRFMSNAMRKIADIEFERTPFSITIMRPDRTNSGIGTITTTTT